MRAALIVAAKASDGNVAQMILASKVKPSAAGAGWNVIRGKEKKRVRRSR